MVASKDPEKAGSYEVEELGDNKSGARVAGVAGEPDYSGAVSKTDETEIRLVRKLDWRIMPTLWAMYFL
jgi:hypothetical protein